MAAMNEMNTFAAARGWVGQLPQASPPAKKEN
jgi:hypothetical protein